MPSNQISVSYTHLDVYKRQGTLISDETHTIPKSARKVLNKLKDKGYLLFLNTGRTKAILDPIISELDFDGQILGCGSYIEYHDKVLYLSLIHI